MKALESEGRKYSKRKNGNTASFQKSFSKSKISNQTAKQF